MSITFRNTKMLRHGKSSLQTTLVFFIEQETNKYYARNGRLSLSSCTNAVVNTLITRVFSLVICK